MRLFFDLSLCTQKLEEFRPQWLSNTFNCSVLKTLLANIAVSLPMRFFEDSWDLKGVVGCELVLTCAYERILATPVVFATLTCSQG